MAVIKNLAGMTMAHGLGQALNIALQLLMPPFLVVCLGLTGYGTFLAAQAYSILFVLVEAGLTPSLQNHILLYPAKFRQEAYYICLAVAKTLGRRIAVTIAIGLSIIVLFSIADPSNTLKHSVVDLIKISAIASISIALQLIASYNQSVKCVTGQEARAVATSHVFRLIEMLGLCVGAKLTGSLIAAISAATATRIVLSAVLILDISHSLREIRNMRGEDADFDAFQQQVAGKITAITRKGYLFCGQSISSSMLPAMLPILLQAAMGAAGLAIFSLARTLSRVPVQFASLLLSTLNIELSRAFAKGRERTWKLLIAFAFTAAGSAAILYSVVSYINLETISKLWLHSADGVPRPLYLALLFGSIATTFTNVTLTIRTASGQLSDQLFISIAYSLLLLAAFCVRRSLFSSNNAGWTVSTVELICCLWLALRSLSRWRGDKS